MPTLIYTTSGGVTRSVELSRKPIKIGRADTCDVVLHDDAEVSREHAEVWLDEQGRINVLDRNSKNGTRVDDGEMFKNTRRVAQRTIRIGEHEMQLQGAPASAPGEPRVLFAPDNPGRTGDTQFFPSTRKLLDLNAQRLNLLIQLYERIGGVFERKQLLEQAIDACCDALGFERCLIALKTQRGDPELPVTRNVQTDETGAFKISRTLINRALVQGERAIVNNPASDLQGNLTESLVRFPICSALCVPILYRGEILGVIYGDRVTQAATYQPADVDFLAAIAQHVGLGLTNLRLAQEYARSQRMFAELEQARLIQQRLLPDRPLTVGGVTIEGHNEPSSAVSGDYYDYFQVDDDRIGFIIADVTGHGLAAALMMANLQSAIRVALSPQLTLADLARRMNQLICRNTAAHVFITGILGVIDTRTREVQYVSAGHPPPISVARGQARGLPQLAENSLPLGVDPEETYAVHRAEPQPGLNAYLFYTDGLIEAMNPHDEMLGLDAVLARFAGMKECTSATLLRQARGLLREFVAGAPRSDDVTLLSVHFGDDR